MYHLCKIVICYVFVIYSHPFLDGLKETFIYNYVHMPSKLEFKQPTYCFWFPFFFCLHNTVDLHSLSEIGVRHSAQR